MTTIDEVMTAVHRACDNVFAEAEEAVADGDWSRAEEAWNRFFRLLEQHITGIEEELLFPAFEEIHGADGPTRIMRMEHEQMRLLAGQIQAVLAGRDQAAVLGFAETLLLLMQQHNMKEEHILYPLMDRSIGNVADILALTH